MGNLHQVWTLLWGTPLIGIAVTVAAYEAGRAAQQSSGGLAIVNPVLIAMLLLIALLELTRTPYETYFESARLLYFPLGPATVALAIPLYRNYQRLRHSIASVMVAVIAGAMAAALSAIGIAWLAGAPGSLLRSIAPKSVTAPIAIGISQEIGGTPGLTAVLVVITGVLGAVISGFVLDRLRVRSAAARGLAMGVAAHGIGTARALAESETAGAFSSLAMALCALLTALFLPPLARLLLG